MAITFKLQAQGITLSQVGEKLKVGSDDSVFAGGEVIMEEAIRRAPFKHGFLRSTGAVIKKERAQYGSQTVDPKTGQLSFGYEDGAEVQLTFTAPYAVVQHERLDFHHEVGQAKYLESAMHDFSKDLPGLFSRIVEAALRSTTTAAKQTKSFLTTVKTTTVYNFLAKTKTRTVETTKVRTAPVVHKVKP